MKIYNLYKDPGDAMRAQDNHKNKKRLNIYSTKKRNELLILSRFDGDNSKSSVEIIDLNDFSIIHKYNPDVNQITKKLSKITKKNFLESILMQVKNDFCFIIPLLMRMEI